MEQLVYGCADYSGVAVRMDNEVLVYQEGSGNIQLIDEFGYEILQMLYRGPKTLVEISNYLSAHFDTAPIEQQESAILRTISSFQAINLVESDPE